MKEENIQALVMLAFLAIIYLIPYLIAASRKHHQNAAIFALNLLLGWTGLGWIAALVWSLTSVQQNVTTTPPTQANPPKQFRRIEVIKKFVVEAYPEASDTEHDKLTAGLSRELADQDTIDNRKMIQTMMRLQS